MQRIFRVPAGFMRNKTQERVEELARERAVSAIDLTLVEDGIEFGKKMMAEMISTYSASSPGGFAPPDPPTPSRAAPTHEAPHGNGDAGAALQPPADPATAGGGYLNEVRSVSAAPRQE